MGRLIEEVKRHEQLYNIFKEVLTHFDTIDLDDDRMFNLLDVADCIFTNYEVEAVFKQWILDRNDTVFMERIGIIKDYYI